jgi:hypothetical protein
MGKQHNNFSKDRDLLAEMYGSMIGAQHTFQDFGNAEQAADHMRKEEGEEHEGHNKTGDLSDGDLLDRATTDDGNLKPEARDALAELYGHDHGHEDHPELPLRSNRRGHEDHSEYGE